ncbi:MAG: polysaccharide deacetylase family protein [Anaerorhabdus sp.]
MINNKKTLLIVISIVVIGILAYFQFFNNKAEIINTENGTIMYYASKETKDLDILTIKDEVIKVYKNLDLEKVVIKEIYKEFNEEISMVLFEVNDEIVWGSLIDNISKNSMFLHDFISDKAQKRVINEFQYIITKDYFDSRSSSLFEEIYSLDYFKSFYINEDKLILTKCVDKNIIQFSFPLDELSKELKLPIENLNEKELSKFRFYVHDDKKKVALTFDDGPHSTLTPQIIDSLFKYHSRANFFVVGNRFDDNMDIVSQLLENGNELGNHTWDHADLKKLSSDEIKLEFDKTDEKIRSISDQKNIFYRPSYGDYRKKIREQINGPIALWSMDTEDWKLQDKDLISEYVMDNVKDKDIILLHDIHKQTQLAIDIFLPLLIDEGYQIVTLDDLIGEIDNEKIYHSGN